MAAYELKADILINVHNVVGESETVGFSSVYTEKVHPGTNTTIDGFVWDKRTWSTQEELAEESYIPTLSDPHFANTSESDWQPGVGCGDDLKLLSVEREYANFNPSGEIWVPRVQHGYFYGGRDEYYLYGEGLKTEYFDTAVDSDGFQYITLSGIPKPTVPLTAYQREYDDEKCEWRYHERFHKRQDFTPIAVSGEYLDLRDDTGALIYENVNSGIAEFIVRFEDTDSPPLLTLNGNYLLGNSCGTLLSGVSGWCEIVGESDGQANQIYYTTYSPLLASGDVRVFSYEDVDCPIEWSVASGVVPLLSGNYNECLVDRDWGILYFGDGTDGAIPALGSTIAVQYTATVGVDYEVEHSPDDYLAKRASVNVSRGENPEGFIVLQKQEVSAASIKLEANLDQIAANLYSPLNVGSSFAEIFATVYGTNGERLDGNAVTFYLSGQTVGSFGSGQTQAISSSDKNGIASVFYVPPGSIDDLGGATDDVSHSGVFTNLLVPALYLPYSGAQLYTFKVMREDVLDGYPEDSVDDYYSGFFTDESINYSVLNDEIDLEGAYRESRDLPVPLTYPDGDLVTGNKLAILVYDYAAIDPDSGTTGAYNMLDPVSFNLTQSGVNITYSGHLDLVTGVSDFKSYFVVAPTEVKFKAFVWSEHLRRNIYSNEITVRIEIPSAMAGVYSVDAIEEIEANILNRRKTEGEFRSLFSGLLFSGVYYDEDFELAYLLEREPYTESREAWFERTRRSDTVLLGLEDVTTLEVGAAEIPLGWRLKSAGITAASAIDGVTFMDPNAGSWDLCLPLFYSDQSALNTLTIQITVDAGGSVFILWGDGDYDEVVADGAVKTITHDYTYTGQYSVRIVGDVHMVTTLDLTGQNIYGDMSELNRFTGL